ncbi:MAG TPA: NAD(P)-dependent oxidoreductase [Xanthobacteraceae bacterium]|nr:NAD(P)-dependent oxidoreductase [Xanthobacteraceae bacterium]
MKIAIIGATGNAGSRIRDEALARGHQVIAIAREAERLPAQPNLVTRNADVSDPSELAKQVAGADAVVSAVRFTQFDPAKLLAAIKKSGVKRYVVVGGAGSLEVAPGQQLMDKPDFPAAFRAEASKGREFLDALRREDELDWTYISPSAMFAPGTRTGTFRTGGDRLLVDAQGKSAISMEDFAIALVDELEQPKHIRRRFTVGY